MLQCSEENVKFSVFEAEEDEEQETWEDLLEMEENVWDPQAAQGR